MGDVSGGMEQSKIIIIRLLDMATATPDPSLLLSDVLFSGLCSQLAETGSTKPGCFRTESH